MDKYYQFGFWFLYLLGMYLAYYALMDGGRIKLGNALEGFALVAALVFWPAASILMMAVNVNDRR